MNLFERAKNYTLRLVPTNILYDLKSLGKKNFNDCAQMKSFLSMNPRLKSASNAKNVKAGLMKV